MADDKTKDTETKDTEETEDEPTFFEQLMTTFVGLTVIGTMVVGLIIGAFKSAAAQSFVLWVRDGLKGVTGTSTSWSVDFLTWASDFWTSKSLPFIKTWSWRFSVLFLSYLGSALLLVFMATWMDNTVMTAVSFIMLAIIPLAVTVVMQGFIRRYSSNGLSTFSASRIPAIVYLCVIQIGAFFIFWVKIGPLLPPEVSLSYTVVGIVFAVLAMSSFSVLLARRRNKLFRAWSWASCILLVLAMLLQIPVLERVAVDSTTAMAITSDRLMTTWSADNWQEYDVIVEGSSTIAFRNYDTSLVSKGDKKRYEPYEVPVNGLTVGKDDMVALNKNDYIAIDGIEHVLYFARSFENGIVVREGYLPLDPSKLRRVGVEKEELRLASSQPTPNALATGNASVASTPPASMAPAPVLQSLVEADDTWDTSIAPLYPLAGYTVEYGPFNSREEVKSVQVMIGFQDQNNDGIADRHAVVSPKAVAKSGGVWVGYTRVHFNDPAALDSMMFRSDNPIEFNVKLLPNGS